MESVFNVPCNTTLGNLTLLQALDLGGGGGIAGAQRTLLRAAAAAVVNASHPNINYPFTAAQVIAAVNGVICGGNRQAILNLAGQLDAANNLGCPLSANANAGAPQVLRVVATLIKVSSPISYFGARGVVNLFNKQ